MRLYLHHTSVRNNPLQGFTIVELVIVIVVIGILAAVTIVAFNGVQARAKDSATQTDLASLRKIISMYQTENGAMPTPPQLVAYSYLAQSKLASKLVIGSDQSIAAGSCSSAPVTQQNYCFQRDATTVASTAPRISNL